MEGEEAAMTEAATATGAPKALGCPRCPAVIKATAERSAVNRLGQHLVMSHGVSTAIAATEAYERGRAVDATAIAAATPPAPAPLPRRAWRDTTAQRFVNVRRAQDDDVDEDLEDAGADHGPMDPPPAATSPCARCRQRPAIPGTTWCRDCFREVGRQGGARRHTRTEPRTTSQKETPPMPRPCGHCKKVGHGRKDCPELKKKAVRPARQQPAKPKKKLRDTAPVADKTAPTSNTATLEGTNEAKLAARRLLTHLKLLHQRLEQKIKHVEELEAML